MEKILLFPRKISKVRGKKLYYFLRYNLGKSLIFVCLLMTYLAAKGYRKLSSYRLFPSFLKGKVSPRLSILYHKTVNRLDIHEENTIKRISLIELALRNMRYKKSRTLITIGGMAVGIGTIVFLVSIGYGIQQLVISRVARLDELKQADVSPLPGGKLRLDDKALSSLKELKDVQMVLPLITVVGRVNFNNSRSDVAVYGVTRDYLTQSAIKPSHGNIFQSNDLANALNSGQEVAGAQTQAAQAELGQSKGSITYSINPGEWIRVRQSPSSSSKILGYTKRVTVAASGTEVYGAKYVSENNAGDVAVDSQGKPLGLWIKDNVLLWQEKTCEISSGDCEDGKHAVLRDLDGQQIQQEGYFAEINVTSQSQDETIKKVLGVSTQSAQVSDTTSAEGAKIDISQISSQSASVDTTKKVSLSSKAKKEAVVNLAMLKILGIKEADAVGKTFTASFIATGDLLNNSTKIQSNPAEYKIVGVIPDERTPVFYVPFVDLRSMGISNYSQVKLVVDNKDNLDSIRRHISALGFTSSSVADTVSQINSLFSTVRTVLGLLGTVALIVAALGMFNTLTVSLLERTREVGLMKAMGMKSEEVRELFLTESMIMGFFGGILGIILGFIAGKILGIILSAFAVFKGAGFIDVSYIPLSFIILIVSLSFIVGLITGIYPARRATKISALNALRYE